MSILLFAESCYYHYTRRKPHSERRGLAIQQPNRVMERAEPHILMKFIGNVILSAAKDLCVARREIPRYAQNDEGLLILIGNIL